MSLTARLINDMTPNTGIFNMAADEFLSRDQSSSEFDAIIRIYRFDPPTVSLGRNQLTSEINESRCSEKGWDIVRRPTGGRTLLHLDDICYSIIIPKRLDAFKDLRNLYEGVAASLATTLITFGIEASPIDLPVKFPFDREIKSTRLCISARVRGEVHVDGRKITSASQRIYQHSILQHGSIFYSGDPTVVADIVAEDLIDGNEFSLKLKDRVITMAEASTELVSMEEFAKCFVRELSQLFEFSLLDCPFFSDELEKIAAKEYYFSLSPPNQNITAA